MVPSLASAASASNSILETLFGLAIELRAKMMERKVFIGNDLALLVSKHYLNFKILGPIHKRAIITANWVELIWIVLS